jgi:urease accessory protein UreF
MKDAGSIVSVDAGVSLDEQAHGLDWVHWLLRSVRQQCEGVVLERQETKTQMHGRWRAFVRERFERGLGSALIEAWNTAALRDAEGLVALEARWRQQLTDEESERSLLAGQLLLKRTQGARYQGALGHFRQHVDDGRADGHIGIVWPALAHLFQLSPAIMLSEYLRLEWETAVRDLNGIAQPFGQASMVKVAARVLAQVNASPPVLRRQQAG